MRKRRSPSGSSSLPSLRTCWFVSCWPPLWCNACSGQRKIAQGFLLSIQEFFLSVVRDRGCRVGIWGINIRIFLRGVISFFVQNRYQIYHRIKRKSCQRDPTNLPKISVNINSFPRYVKTEKQNMAKKQINHMKGNQTPIYGKIYGGMYG